jgi:hypothetical protein
LQATAERLALAATAERLALAARAEVAERVASVVLPVAAVQAAEQRA